VPVLPVLGADVDGADGVDVDGVDVDGVVGWVDGVV